MNQAGDPVFAFDVSATGWPFNHDWVVVRFAHINDGLHVAGSSGVLFI